MCPRWFGDPFGTRASVLEPTCHPPDLHSNGDALEIAVRDGRMVGVRGIARSRVNHGRLGPKDLYGWQANGSPDRLTRPLIRRDAEPDGGLLARAREKASELMGRRPEAGLLLLRDLRELHLLYAEASIDWVLLNQGAQAIRDGELVATVADCHAQTLRGMKWTVTRLKTAAPQVLAA